jgi:hypothetical protein
MTYKSNTADVIPERCNEFRLYELPDRTSIIYVAETVVKEVR